MRILVPSGLIRRLSQIGDWRRKPFLGASIFMAIVCGSLLFAYLRYARNVDQKLRFGMLESPSMIYAAPRTVVLGGDGKIEELASYLRRCGYTESKTNRMGWYQKRGDTIEIHPGRDGYVQQGAAIQVQAGHIARIASLSNHASLPQVSLEPEVITNFFDQSRDKQLIVHFAELPKVVVNAVLSAEDKRFFHHWGFDPAGILRAVWVDAKGLRRSQGASTLTQQLARTLMLGQERGWRRKIPETLITLHLEHTLTKQQIFEDYANSIYLGHLGSFSIHGFGKASRVYLGKDLSQVTLADAALLAGMIQAPSTRNPFRYPDRAKARRNAILKAMRTNGYVSEREYQDAAASPLNVTRGEGETTDAPYFVDLVDETLQNQFQDRDFQNSSFRVYTSLDMNLQRDAEEAVRTGIQETDRLWRNRSKKYGTSELPLVQAALVALDAQTGEVKALVGGRSYGLSQLNRATARRQPGSSFKPFVYAAALGSALANSGPVLTAASTVEDEPTTFYFHGKPYDPSDHERDYAGEVTLRYALAHSLNIPAVKVAETVGYNQVARVARAAGLNVNIAPTPSIALGAYEVTPLEIAGAYTVFANYGMRQKTGLIRSIRDQHAASIFEWQPERKPAMDARVAYLTENLMEEVLRSGTGAGVRARGFYLPAAGKTGTSRDGWFAGFTSRLICVVWVGFDDNRDIKLEGARSALPIWTEFMKRAHQHKDYANVHEFEAPSGIVTVQIDADSGELATPNCHNVRSEVFIEGTQPVQACHLHSAVPTPAAQQSLPDRAVQVSLDSR
ncbi:MAG TPA: PBP1A family penicillin-binding protein [Terriglobales bacterium]|nr:PBP1A family penicillin-binding protein [Terriglobales bacterium]